MYDLAPWFMDKLWEADSVFELLQWIFGQDREDVDRCGQGRESRTYSGGTAF